MVQATGELSIMPLSIMPIGIMPLSIIPLSIMPLSIMTQRITTLSTLYLSIIIRLHVRLALRFSTKIFRFFQDLNSPPQSPSKDFGTSKFSGSGLPPVLRRKNNSGLQNCDSGLKNQYRCSLINLEECTQVSDLQNFFSLLPCIINTL
jgi:hypothetical protein